MRILVKALLPLVVALAFAGPLHGCGIEELLEEDTPSEPTPDELAEAALASKPERTDTTIGQGVICPGSFRRFKRRIAKSSKDPGPGYEWHHIVNQNETNVANFGNRLHCTDNLIALPTSLHRKVSGHFTEKPAWTKGKHVRDVINKRGWTEQYDYGLKVLRDNGINP